MNFIYLLWVFYQMYMLTWNNHLLIIKKIHKLNWYKKGAFQRVDHSCWKRRSGNKHEIIFIDHKKNHKLNWYKNGAFQRVDHSRWKQRSRNNPWKWLWLPPGGFQLRGQGVLSVLNPGWEWYPNPISTVWLTRLVSSLIYLFFILNNCSYIAGLMILFSRLLPSISAILGAYIHITN